MSILQFNHLKSVGSIIRKCVEIKCYGTGSINLQDDQCSGDPSPIGLVLGTYSEKVGSNYTVTYTHTTEKFDRYIDGKLNEALKSSGPVPQRNEVRMLYNVDPKFPIIGLVGLGPECLGYNDIEQRDENKERIREASGAACKLLQKTSKVQAVYLESFGHAESSAEGAAMGLWSYQEHKHSDNRDFVPKIYLFDDCDLTGWRIGLHKAAGQNLARQLTEAPANLLSPRTFAEHTIKILNASSVNIEMKIKRWLQMVGMDSFLAVARGSCDEPVLMEAAYYGCNPDVCPIVLIGKGTTFDSGGLCLKQKRDMQHMRSDMAGAACIIGALRAVSALELPINIRALIPMCENMIGPRAMKPGDIVNTLRGKSIVVRSTDTEGRLSMVDVLTYANTFKPKFILDIGTLNKSTAYALGHAATPVWSTNDALWEQMRVAGVHSGDRVWRFPLWNHYKKRAKYATVADLKDSDSTLGGPNLTAALLKEFVCQGDWMHMDIYSVTRTSGETSPYLRKGMTGRPTRTLIEFLAQFACQLDGKKKPACAKPNTPKCKLVDC